MGNAGSSAGNGRRRNGGRRTDPTQAPPPAQVLANHYVFAAATPFPPQYTNPNGPGGYYPPYPHATGYYPPPPMMPMPMAMPAPYDRVPQQLDHGNWGGAGRFSYGPGPVMPPPPPVQQASYVEHQKAVTIRNDVNLKKETFRIEPDEENPGKFVVAFTFDATVPARITVIFFAKESEECKLTPIKESLLPPVTVQFPQGLGQKFRQPPGTGIDFAMFEEKELLREGDVDIYPLVVKAEVIPPDDETGSDGTQATGSTNSQITQAVFEKEKGVYHVKVVKQILWVSGMRYELQEIYGIGNSVEGDTDGNDPGKECVICLSEPRDTTVLPCRHMCMCSGCAKVLSFQTNRCPICRQPVERLLEIKVSNDSADRTQTEVGYTEQA